MQEYVNRRVMLFGVALVGVSLAILGAVTFYNARTMPIIAAPESAKILLDGKEISNGSRQWVREGDHTVTVSADGFKTLTEKLSAQGKQDTNYLFCLQPLTSAAKDTINNARNSPICEGVAGRYQKELANKVYAANPILKSLPFNEGLFSIGQGLSEKYPNDEEKFALYVHYYNDEALADAKKWLAAHGDLNSLEVIYSKDYSDNRTTGGDLSPAYAALKKNYPIVDKLPYKNPYYTISYRSQNSHDLRLVVFTSSPRWRYTAVQQLNILGFDPTDYPIEFVDFLNPLEGEK